MSYVIPQFVSERVGNGPYDNCVPNSCIMALNGLHPGTAASTNAEGDRLRLASGYTLSGPTSVERILAGAQKLYGIGHVNVIGRSFTALWAALIPGHAAFLIIQPDKAPATSVLRKGVGLKFGGEHGIYVERLDTRLAVWMLDPMGGLPGSTYKGNLVQQAALEQVYVGSAAIFGIASA